MLTKLLKDQRIREHQGLFLFYTSQIFRPTLPSMDFLCAGILSKDQKVEKKANEVPITLKKTHTDHSKLQDKCLLKIFGWVASSYFLLPWYTNILRVKYCPSPSAVSLEAEEKQADDATDKQNTDTLKSPAYQPGASIALPPIPNLSIFLQIWRKYIEVL